MQRNGENQTYPVSFAGVFHDVVSAVDFDPVLYMLELTKRVYDLEHKEDNEKLAGFLSRAFRSLTSFLKEPAFAEDLRDILETKAITHEIFMSQDEDAANHTDIKAVVDGKIFRLWIYQCSDTGIPHDIDRVAGRCGELPSGIHVLCPLNTSKAMWLGKLESQRSRFEIQQSKWQALLSQKKNRHTRSYDDLQDKIHRKEHEIAELEKRIDETYQNSGIDIINGFFLYPREYVEEVAEKITKVDLSPDDYHDLVKMINAPRDYVSTLNFFIV